MASSEAQGWWGVKQDKEIRDIIDSFPQVILFTGHTHWHLESKNTMFKGENATMFNAGAVSYLWNDNDTGVEGSQGFIVEVYNDIILVRGRDFVNNKWISSAQFAVELIPSKAQAEFSITSPNTLVKGEAYTAPTWLAIYYFYAA